MGDIPTFFCSSVTKGFRVIAMHKLPPEIEAKMPQICSRIAAEGAELVEIKINRARGGNVLTFSVDKPGGVTLEDCARINTSLGENFDFLLSSYSLEVESLGLDRPLRSKRDFERVLMAAIQVSYRRPDGKGTTLVGVLQAVSEQGILIRWASGKEEEILFENIMNAKRTVEI